MGTTLHCVDIVGEGKNVLRIAIVPLHRDFGIDAILLALQINNFGMNRRFSAIQMLNKRNDPAFIEQLVFFLSSLVLDGDLHSSIQERQLA